MAAEPARSASPASVALERAGMADAPELARLAAVSLVDAWSELGFRAELESAASRIWIAREGTGEAVGYVAVRLGPGFLHVASIAVAPAWRGRGIGSALLRAACAAGAGTERALLEVRASNRAARRFYARHGFVEAGLRPRGYPDGEAAVEMARSLADESARA